VGQKLAILSTSFVAGLGAHLGLGGFLQMRRSACILSAAILTTGFLLVSGDARAQGTESTSTTSTTTTTAPAGSGAAGASGAAAADDDHEEGRLRIGFNINGGVGTGANISGPTIGATFRIGWQFNRLMAVYGNLSPYVWIGSSDNVANGASLGAIAGFQTTPMFSLTPIDLLELAAGPSVDYLSGGGVETTANGASTTVGGFSSVYFAVHGRLALHLGGRNPDTGRRKGFTIGADIHPTFAEGSTLTFFTVGLGADWY